jgi:hypothetical protein
MSTKNKFLAVYPKFVGAKRYVREGISKSSFEHELMTEDYDEEKIKGAVWDDTIINESKTGNM